MAYVGCGGATGAMTVISPPPLPRKTPRAASGSFKQHCSTDEIWSCLGRRITALRHRVERAASARPRRDRNGRERAIRLRRQGRQPSRRGQPTRCGCEFCWSGRQETFLPMRCCDNLEPAGVETSGIIRHKSVASGMSVAIVETSGRLRGGGGERREPVSSIAAIDHFQGTALSFFKMKCLSR